MNTEIKNPEVEFELPLKKNLMGDYIVLPNTKYIGGKNCLRDLAAKKTKQGYVYLINIFGTNKYKIGVSTKIKRRLADISSAIPFELNILAINFINDPYQVEQSIITTHKSKLIKNEWFNLTKNEAKEIMIQLHNIQVDESRETKKHE
jgi:hypothetical protein